MMESEGPPVRRFLRNCTYSGQLQTVAPAQGISVRMAAIIVAILAPIAALCIGLVSRASGL